MISKRLGDDLAGTRQRVFQQTPGRQQLAPRHLNNEVPVNVAARAVFQQHKHVSPGPLYAGVRLC